MLHKFQSGFRSGHSTETALTLMTERWLKAINDGNIVGTIMIDFRKAFDLVDHDLLIHKLSLYKCGTNFLKLMASYLKSRTQVVSVHGKNLILVKFVWCSIRFNIRAIIIFSLYQ